MESTCEGGVQRICRGYGRVLKVYRMYKGVYSIQRYIRYVWCGTM